MAFGKFRFVMGQDGQPKAVQVELALWRKILAVLEDADDVALARGVLAELDAAGGPEAAGWTKLDDIAANWEIG